MDRIIFKPITDGANRFNALRTGDVQMADRLAPLDAVRVKKGEIKGVTVLEAPLGGFQYLVVSHLNPLFEKREGYPYQGAGYLQFNKGFAIFKPIG